MGTKYTAEAATSREFQVKTVISCTFLMIIVLIALGLTLYNIIKLRFGFVIGYLLGMALALMFVFIKLNIAFPVKISADRKTVMLRVWKNRLLPYKTDCNIPFFREFIPEKVINDKIEISQIKTIFVGTKSFISRSTADENFNMSIKKLIPENDIKKITKCDLLCICDYENKYHIMSLENFDTRAAAKIITNVLRVNPEVDFITGSKMFKAYVRR